MFDVNQKLGLVLWMALILIAPIATTAQESQIIGAGVTLEEITPIAEILATPLEWDGREARVAGQVSGVCAKKGCWMELADPAGKALTIRVEDDVLVFPADAEGLEAQAQGRVRVRELEREQYLGWQKHLAADRGEDFDETTLGDGPYLLVEIAGTGAQVAKH